MSQTEATIHQCKCDNPNCGHTWKERKPSPKLCPRCHSPYWNEPEHWTKKPETPPAPSPEPIVSLSNPQ